MIQNLLIFKNIYFNFILNHSGIQTKAIPQGDDLIINGGKMWTTNGCQADWMCLLACTSDGPPHKNKSLICLPMNLPGKPTEKEKQFL